MTEPLSIEGIDTAGVGSPSNDGSAGSALYRVPIKVSRTMTNFEAEAMVRVWNSPPQYTSMHRPGIMRAYGKTLELDGTTLEEVGKYHRDTLKLVVAEVNRYSAEHEAKVEAKKVADDAAEAAHRANVEEAAKRISFD